MAKYFECKIRYEKQITDPNDKDCGKLKKVNEVYLVDALSYTEAEARIVKEVAQYIKGEYSITNIKQARLAELIFKDDDLCENWFTVKIKITVVDENSGTERLVPETLLVRAEDLSDALKRFKDAFKDSMADYIITSIAASPILEYFNSISN
ncbi:MAG: DUF4494 domain-containing protein [Paludibacteraceae bacterium]|nr:DUF4494 domain-containing protein [Paludibacteraceae bacterium]